MDRFINNYIYFDIAFRYSKLLFSVLKLDIIGIGKFSQYLPFHIFSIENPEYSENPECISRDLIR